MAWDYTNLIFSFEYFYWDYTISCIQYDPCFFRACHHNPLPTIVSILSMVWNHQPLLCLTFLHRVWVHLYDSLRGFIFVFLEFIIHYELYLFGSSYVAERLYSRILLLLLFMSMPLYHPELCVVHYFPLLDQIWCLPHGSPDKYLCHYDFRIILKFSYFGLSNELAQVASRWVSLLWHIAPLSRIKLFLLELLQKLNFLYMGSLLWIVLWVLSKLK